MRKYQPRCGLPDVKIGHQIRLVSGRLVPGNGSANLLWGIAAGTFRQLINYGLDGMTGIEYVVDDQNTIFVADFFNNVIQAMHRDSTAFVNTDIGRCSNGNVIGIDSAVCKNFLHGHTDRSATTPNSNDERWLESALQYL